jgi:Lsr2
LPGSRAKWGDPVKCGARVALGVAGGYFLGRSKQMKLALALAGMAAGKRAGGPGQLLAQGTKLLGQSPEMTRLTDELRGRLLHAGKGAAVAIATRQVESLTERVVNRVGDLTEAGGKTVGGVGKTVGGVGETAAGVGRKVGGLGKRQSRDDVEYDDEYEDEYDETADESVTDASGDESDDNTGTDQADESAELGEPRLEFKHFRRHAKTNVLLQQEEVEGWRGEMGDSEVVKTHEQALEEEQAQQDESASTEDESAQDETTEEAGPAEATEEEVPEDGELPEDELPKGEAAEEGDVNDRNLNVKQQVPVKWPDSVDGSEASETMTFALDGRRFTLDLSKDNTARLRQALAPFVAVARRSGRGRRASRQTVVLSR